MVNKNILRSRIEKIEYHLSRIKLTKSVSYEAEVLRSQRRKLFDEAGLARTWEE